MFVEELENLPQRTGDRFSPFLISTPAEIARLMRSKVMSVVINVHKGLDIHNRTPQAASFDRQAAESWPSFKFLAARRRDSKVLHR